MKSRSDSTIQLRSRLNNDYVIVPNVIDSTPILKYIDILKLTLKSAKSFDGKGLLSQSYIDYKKFLVLFLNLSKHNDYKSKQISIEISTLEKDAKDAFDKLENIVIRMDEAEDKRIELEQRDSSILELIDQFDNSENYIITTQQSDDIWLDLLKLKINTSSSSLSEPIVSSSSSSSSSSLISSRLNILNCEQADELKIPNVDQYPNIFEFSSSPKNITTNSGNLGISLDDIQICGYLKDIRSFYIPPPFRSYLNINIGSKCYQFIKDDFHVTFSAFLKTIPEELQMARSALETNRCFFLHLAVAMNIHPFALQTAFRYLATKKLLQLSKEDMKVDVLNTINEFAGFVDANCLCFLWLQEFNSSRICIISGSNNKPIFSCFSLKNKRDIRDVIIYCDGSHFTLLKPNYNSENFCILPQLLMEAEKSGHVVYINEIESDNDNINSVTDIIYMLTNNTL